MKKQIDVKKLIRQLRGCVKFIRNGGRGTLEWCTGMGKTFAAMLIIKKLQKRNPNRNATVIVPTIQLKDQWEEEIRSFGLKNVSVYVINTVVLTPLTIKTDLLILDEIHRFASIEFMKVFNLVQYRFILGLTATIERLDGNHSLLVSHAPVVDTISLSEARINKWISEYIEFNLGITMTDADQKVYDEITMKYNKFFKMFGFDFDLAMKCQAGKSKSPGGIDGPTVRLQYAMIMGWDSVKDANNKHHLWHPDTIAGYAIQFGKYMRLRKEYLYKAQCKIDMAEKLANHFTGRKIITFSESTEFADRVTNVIPGSLSYHSYIPGETIEVDKRRVFKTEAASIKFYDSKVNTLKTLKRTGKEVIWKEAKKLSPKFTRSEMLRKFEDNRYNLRVINTAKALDQGLDVADIEIAMIFSRTSNPTQQIQRIGRSARKFKFASGVDKIALVINVYIIGTQDEKWLKAAQSKSKNSISWITSIDQISLGRMSQHHGIIDEQEPGEDFIGISVDNPNNLRNKHIPTGD